MIRPDPVHRRSVAWAKDDPAGAEHAEFELAPDQLRARGTAIGSDPVAYRLDFELDSGPDFVAPRVAVATRGEGWARSIVLERVGSGSWSCEPTQSGTEPDMPEPGGDMAQFDDAFDPDLGLSPVFNSMPVLRHRLLHGGETPELLMAWISVPDLTVSPSTQRYSHVRQPSDGNHLIHFEARDPAGEDFAADIVYDSDGIVVDYPGIASRIG